MQKAYWFMKMTVYLALVAFTAAAAFVNDLKGDLGVHDPVLIKAGSTYYVYSTGNLLQGKASGDRITWRNTGSVLNPGPTWFSAEAPGNNGTDAWAPDISLRNGTFWLYYSVSSFGKNTSAIGLAISPTLSNPTWTDKGVVIKSIGNNNYNCIDPNIFTDDDGKVWLSFGSFWSGIKIVELDPATGKPRSVNPQVTAIAQYVAGIEAPFIIKRGKYYYLFVSWDSCCKGVSSTYKIVVGRSIRVDGGYVDKTGKSMLSAGGTILDAGDEVRKGPGHNGIFTDNDTTFCVNHYYDATANGASRLQIRPLYWDTEWPSFTGTITGPPPVGTMQRLSVPAVSHYREHYRVVVASDKLAGKAGLKVYTIAGKRVYSSSGPAARGSSTNINRVMVIDKR